MKSTVLTMFWIWTRLFHLWRWLVTISLLHHRHIIFMLIVELVRVQCIFHFRWMRELKLDGECFLLAEQHLILEIHSKYFDKSSEYYETNLTDTERRIAYNYEMQNALNVGNNGKNLYKHIYYCSMIPLLIIWWSYWQRYIVAATHKCIWGISSKDVNITSLVLDQTRLVTGHILEPIRKISIGICESGGTYEK